MRLKTALTSVLEPPETKKRS